MWREPAQESSSLEKAYLSKLMNQILELGANDSHGRWFAAHVKSRCERVVALVAHNKGYQNFLPVYKVRRLWSDRTKVSEAPLFPGYLFCRLDHESWLPLLTIPGVKGLVGAGKTPLPIDDAEIAALQVATQSGLPAEPHSFIQSGQRVLLEQGPLAGIEGYFIRGRKQHRIVVSVTLLQRSVGIEIERDWAKPLKKPSVMRNANLQIQEVEPSAALSVAPPKLKIDANLLITASNR
jgi:transcription antitermination factor NusG